MEMFQNGSRQNLVCEASIFFLFFVSDQFEWQVGLQLSFEKPVFLFSQFCSMVQHLIARVTRMPFFKPNKNVNFRLLLKKESSLLSGDSDVHSCEILLTAN